MHVIFKKFFFRFLFLFFFKVFKLKASVRVGIIELTEPSDTVIYKSFFKHCILQTILHEFLLIIFMWKKIFCSKNWAVFYIFLIWFKVVVGDKVLKVLCLWCSFSKVIGKWSFISYRRFNLWGIAIKTVF